MRIVLRFLINSLFVFACNDNGFTSEFSSSYTNTYESISSDNETTQSSKETEIIEDVNNNYKQLSYIPISVVDCEQLEKTIRGIYDFNVYKSETFKQIADNVYNNTNSNGYKSKFYLDHKAQNKCFISNSAFALKLSEELTNNTKKLQQYRSKYYAMNCYKTLVHLMYTIGKDQDNKEGSLINIGTIKLNLTIQKHITSFKKQEQELYMYSNNFRSFYNYFLTEIYPRMFDEPIYISVLLKLGEALAKKSNEVIYINTSLLPQVKTLIGIANKIKKHIILLNTRIDSFKTYLNEIKKVLFNNMANNKVMNILYELNDVINTGKHKIEINISKCDELINKIRNKVNKIASKQWSYAYSLSKELPVLATRINRSKNIIIESNFSFAHNLDYLIKLIEADKISNDYTYNQQINSILEELKHFDYLD